MYNFFMKEWNVILDNIEIELNGVWTGCTLYRHKDRCDHVCIYFDGDWIEGNHENKGYIFDENTMKLYDTDGDLIEYRRSIIL